MKNFKIVVASTQPCYMKLLTNFKWTWRNIFISCSCISLKKLMKLKVVRGHQIFKKSANCFFYWLDRKLKLRQRKWYTKANFIWCIPLQLLYRKNQNTIIGISLNLNNLANRDKLKICCFFNLKFLSLLFYGA